MASSHRQILRSSSIVGGASLINVVLGLVRMKVAALILGPAGVGLIGLFQNIIATGSTVAGMGVGGAANRQIASSRSEHGDEGEAVVRRAVFWATIILAVAGAALMWVARKPIAKLALGDEGLSAAVGWLAIGVALTVALNSQNGLLAGLRRIGDIARVNLISGLLATAATLCALYWLGSDAILFFVLAFPLAGFLTGAWFVSRLPKLAAVRTPPSALSAQWRTLAVLGFAMMLGALINTLGPLAVRGLIKAELGLIELGHFQAAWTISMTYLVTILYAMGADYHPRLSAAIKDRETANRMVNEQIEVVLLLAGPILLIILGGAPWILHMIYSSEFRDAAAILRWQIIGDLLKIAGWPMGFVPLAAGDGRMFVAIELFAMTIFVALTWILLPLVGIEASGLAFLGMYAVYFPAVYLAARSKTGFRLEGHNSRLLGCLMAASGVILLVTSANPFAAFALAILFAAATLALAAHRLEEALPAPIASGIATVRRWVSQPWSQ